MAVSGTETEQDSVFSKLAIFTAGPSQVQQPLLVPYFLYVKKGFSLLGLSWVPKRKLKYPLFKGLSSPVYILSFPFSPAPSSSFLLPFLSLILANLRNETLKKKRKEKKWNANRLLMWSFEPQFVNLNLYHLSPEKGNHLGSHSANVCQEQLETLEIQHWTRKTWFLALKVSKSINGDKTHANTYKEERPKKNYV